MKTIKLKRCFLIFLFPFIFFDKSNAQLQPVIQVHLSYPKIKESKSLYVFLSGKNMGKIDYGQRLIYDFYDEGNLKVTIQENERFTEPKTISGNSRIINLKSGSSYFFEINGKSDLVYIPDPVKGKEYFEKKNYFSSPLKHEISSADSLIHK